VTGLSGARADHKSTAPFYSSNLLTRIQNEIQRAIRRRLLRITSSLPHAAREA